MPCSTRGPLCGSTLGNAYIDAGTLALTQHTPPTITGTGPLTDKPPEPKAASKAPDTAPLLSETKTWFETVVIPKRTANAGFDGNRVWKSPRAIVLGNVEDPNGLCGDAAEYVVEEFYRNYTDYQTSDGYRIGVILWKGNISNHIANIMLKKGKLGPEEYTWNATAHEAKPKSPSPNSYGSAELCGLNVYDLYYKKATTVYEWWMSLDNKFGGTIKIALLYTIEE